MKHLGLVPIRNFAVVDANKGLFRSAQPEYSYEYDWLKKVAGIDLIINLRSESRHDSVMCEGRGIKIVNIDVPDHHEPTLQQAHRFMDLVEAIAHSSKKVLFHCEHGHGRTSTFCVLARLATGWTLEEAIKEETEKFHYSFHHHAQIDFLRKHFSTQNQPA